MKEGQREEVGGREGGGGRRREEWRTSVKGCLEMHPAVAQDLVSKKPVTVTESNFFSVSVCCPTRSS